MSKLIRTINILFDRSEAFKDRPSYKYEVILHIWKSK